MTARLYSTWIMSALKELGAVIDRAYSTGEKLMNLRIPLVLLTLILSASERTSTAQSTAAGLKDAVTADSRHYSVEFENDIVRVLRVRLGAGESAPAHTHTAYCAIELSDSSLKEGNGPVSESKAGQV